MCRWWGTPYKAYVIEDSPKEKQKKEEEEKVEYYLVQPGDQWVPVGQVSPHLPLVWDRDERR
ncbi:hypothetical protein ACJ72_02285 [Emergomyces africanus]|uniref:Uncharacterized protein n=1 Tax=Emergomyces africanus TaxID=1955775 RepID=A0A1B7P2Y0_9EURO|nr:hypothetical protein ACJ72_02285 [Emergomyces africanus]